MTSGLRRDIFPSCEWYLGNNTIIWWNITFTNCRSVTAAPGADKISFLNKLEREKDGSTFHDREQHLSPEPLLISKISVLHYPLDGKFLAINNKISHNE